MIFEKYRLTLGILFIPAFLAILIIDVVMSLQAIERLLIAIVYVIATFGAWKYETRKN